MVIDGGRTNGFRVTSLNQDCDRLAVQSSVQRTWFLTYRGGLRGRMNPWSKEVGITQSELIVMRPYRGKPVIQIEGLGGPYGVLILERANGGATVLRNGQRELVELDAALVIKTEHFREPRAQGKDHGGV